jgi:hypothetical protein
MLASTILAVIFVPSFFVVVERIAEKRKQRKEAKAAAKEARRAAKSAPAG